ncbi:BtrH N-terminal domain-containing protein [Streptomyces sp. NPDC091272]|uniref:BtrH N-terminal domain-containing protein n=1 Tax=Streptomyces sp. NPDC091272 TaxID=3365981 RepID=UPI0038260E3E
MHEGLSFRQNYGDTMHKSAPLDLGLSCAEHLARVPGALLDCVSDDLSLLLAYHGVRENEEPFSVDWRFDLREDPGGAPPRLRMPAADLEARIAARTGLLLTWRAAADTDRDARDWAEQLEGGRPVLVVGDAYHLPWLPYHGNEHMDHGFVVDGVHGSLQHPRELVLDVIDPYDNATRWGTSRPLSTTISLADLAPALPGGRWGVLRNVPQADSHPSAEQLMADNLLGLRSAVGENAFKAFCAGLDDSNPDSWDHYTLQTWLLARSRALHLRWLTAHAHELRDFSRNAVDLPVLFGENVANPWKQAAQSCYLAARRSAAGKSAPPSARESLERAAASEAEFVEFLGRHSQ